MNFLGFIVLAIIFIIFHNWFFLTGTLSSGDWPYLFVENIKEFSFFPENRFLWLAPYYQIPTKLFVQYLGIRWEITERILWFFPFLIFSTLSSYYLTRSWIGTLIYTTNTYILMLVGGGQMGMAMAYALTPFVFKKFVNFIHFYSAPFRSSIFLGLILAILTMFDPRIAYMLLIAIAIYAVFNIPFVKETIRYTLNAMLYVFLIPLVITFALNTYWIIPLLQGNGNYEFKGLGNIAGFEFLSFSDFSQAFSLLHPNWPENIFGKTYFLQPEFLLLPILAYISLLFIKNPKPETQNPKQSQNAKLKIINNLAIEQFDNRTILFFALLGLLGAFLVKGANEPFGFLNQWMFRYFPGMNMFRDPTKFYILVALAYSVLIPFSLFSIYGWLTLRAKRFVILNSFQDLSSGSRNKFGMTIYKFGMTISLSFLLLTILYLIFLIRPAVLGQLGGTFKPHAVPQEYLTLKNFIVNKKDSFATLWIPKVQRYGFHSKINQVMSADELLGAYSILAIQKKFQDAGIEDTIKKLNIRYIIVPYDSQKEIFLKDRKYDSSLYDSTVVFLQNLKWIEKETSFGNIIVFRVRE